MDSAWVSGPFWVKLWYFKYFILLMTRKLFKKKQFAFYFRTIIISIRVAVTYHLIYYNFLSTQLSWNNKNIIAIKLGNSPWQSTFLCLLNTTRYRTFIRQCNIKRPAFSGNDGGNCFSSVIKLRLIINYRKVVAFMDCFVC